MPSSPAIILVRPRNPFNIGAVARAMANFGLSDLRVVSPHPPIWREAKKAAVSDSAGLLDRAQVFATLAEAGADRIFMLATSAVHARSPHLPVYELPSIPRPKGKWAIVFGPEKTGLTTDHLEYCDAVLKIPTSAKCHSMNLSHAAAVVGYALTVPKAAAPIGMPARISSAGVEAVISGIETAFKKIRYRPALTPAKRKTKVRKLLRIRGVSKGEAGLLREILRRIEEIPG